MFPYTNAPRLPNIGLISTSGSSGSTERKNSLSASVGLGICIGTRLPTREAIADGGGERDIQLPEAASRPGQPVRPEGVDPRRELPPWRKCSSHRVHDTRERNCASSVVVGAVAGPRRVTENAAAALARRAAPGTSAPAASAAMK